MSTPAATASSSAETSSSPDSGPSASSSPKSNSRPITQATCIASRALAGRRAIRREVTSRTPSGTPASSRSPPVSLRCRTTSSTKNGLPSVSPCSAETKSDDGASAPSAATSSATSPRASPSSGTWVSIPSRRSEAISVGQRMVLVDLGLAVGAEEHRAPRLRRPHEVAQQLQRRAVGPLQVVEHEQQRRAGGDLRQQRGEGVEQALALDARLGLDRRGRPDGRAELGQQRGEVGRARAEPLRGAGQRGAARPAAQHLEHRLVGAGAGLVEAAEQHDRAVAVDGAGELRGEPRLADPRVAGEQDEPPLVADRRVPRLVQRAERLLAADERVAGGRGPERGGQRAGRETGGRGRLGRRRVAAQQPRVERHHGRPGRRAELVAQQLAQLVERAQRLGGVARRLVDLHQQPVRGLAERRQPDRGARGVLGGVELAAAEPQPRLAERLQRAQAQALDLAAAVAHPRPVALGEERLGAERERGAGLRGGVLPAAVVERLGRDLDGVGERLGVDPQRLGQREPQLGAAGQRVGAERAAELRKQRGERGVRRRGRVLRPQHVLELVARAGAGPVVDEVGEQQLALAPGQRRAGQPIAVADRDTTAQPDLPPSH